MILDIAVPKYSVLTLKLPLSCRVLCQMCDVHLAFHQAQRPADN
jgi:hypothetical protein